MKGDATENGGQPVFFNGLLGAGADSETTE
jgi:hypothetical protein